jgi:Carboxypeptidase regulatory-like domain
MMNCFRLRIFLISLLLLLPVGLIPSHAQTFQGSLTGVVTDSSGAVIPGATVTALEQGTGYTRADRTASDGRYDLALLPPGNYMITVKAAGFDTLTRGPLALTVNDHLKIDFQLKVGSQTRVITIIEPAPVLDTQDASVGTTIERTKIEEIPLNGRHFLELTLLTPGVVPGTPDSRISDRGGAINVNGMRDSMNSYWLDGMDDTAIGVGQFTVIPPLDSVEEFRMETGSYDAKFGAHAGAQVNIVTRSGSNKIHGSLHEFFRNTNLDARNFFDPATAPEHRNEFGGALGGPVDIPGVYDGHSHTFFFGAYEGTRDRLGFYNRARVPTVQERNGDFTGDLSPSCPVQNFLIDPNALLSGSIQPLVGPGGPNTLPYIDPVGQGLVNLYPEPNVSNAACGSVNYVGLVNRKIDQDNYFGRIDHNWGNQDNLFFRYNVNRDHEDLPSGTSSRAASTNVPGYGTITHDQYQMAGIDWTHTFSSSMLNELKLGYNRWQIRENTEDQGNTIALQLGLLGLNATNPIQIGVPDLNFTGYDSIGSNTTDPQSGAVNTFQVADTLTHVYGTHTFAYGADVRSVDRGNFTIDSLIHGEFNFTGTVTGGLGEIPPGVDQLLGCVAPACEFGNGIADALLGMPTFWLNGFEQSISGHLGEYDFFVQDTWKARPNLTVSYGLRYEYKGLATDKYNRFANFDFNTGQLMVAGNKQVTLEQFDPNTGLYDVVGSASLGGPGENRSLQKPDKNNFAPRFGLAWQPFHDTSTVIRGGYGIFYNQTFGDVFFQKAANPPFVQLDAGNIGAALPLIGAGMIIPGSGQLIQQALAGIVGPEFPTVSPFQISFRDAQIQEWNLDLQKELPGSWLIDLGYIGTRGVRLPREVDPNQPAPDPATHTAVSPYPLYGGFSYTESSGSSIYHALQVKAEKHYSRGLAILASYTYSKSLDTNSSEFTTSRDQNFPENSNNLAAEKGLSDFDFRHRLSVSYVYDLPIGNTVWRMQNSRANAVISGWQLAGVFTAQSGPPFTPQISGDLSHADEQNVIGTGFPTDRPNLTGSRFYPADKTPNQYLLASAFSAPAPYTFGNAGRNILRGPGLSSWDFGVVRRFRTRETRALEFRAEIFNIANHPNFDIPQRDLASASFGQIFNTLRPIAGPISGGPGEPREVQFALKYAW